MALEDYLVPKLSTQRANVVLHVFWCHRPGVYCVHSMSGFELYAPISFRVGVVFIYDLLRNHSVVHAYVLEIQHGCAMIEVLDSESTLTISMFGI